MWLRRLLWGGGVGKSGLRVAFLTSEAVPFAKTGGLGDVSGALPKALVGAGLDACLIHPLYATTDRRLLSERVFDNLEVDWLGGRRTASASRLLPIPGAPKSTRHGTSRTAASVTPGRLGSSTR